MAFQVLGYPENKSIWFCVNSQGFREVKKNSRRPVDDESMYQQKRQNGFYFIRYCTEASRRVLRKKCYEHVCPYSRFRLFLCSSSNFHCVNNHLLPWFGRNELWKLQYFKGENNLRTNMGFLKLPDCLNPFYLNFKVLVLPMKCIHLSIDTTLFNSVYDGSKIAHWNDNQLDFQ